MDHAKGPGLGHRFLGLLQPGSSIHYCKEGACADSAPDSPLHSARWGLVPPVFKLKLRVLAASLQLPSTGSGRVESKHRFAWLHTPICYLSNKKCCRLKGENIPQRQGVRCSKGTSPRPPPPPSRPSSKKLEDYWTSLSLSRAHWTGERDLMPQT